MVEFYLIYLHLFFLPGIGLATEFRSSGRLMPLFSSNGTYYAIDAHQGKESAILQNPLPPLPNDPRSTHAFTRHENEDIDT